MIDATKANTKETRELARELAKCRPDAGCTANICLIVGNDIYCANVGDSRSCIAEDGSQKSLSEDHKPTLRREKERVEAAGGFIIRGRL